MERYDGGCGPTRLTWGEGVRRGRRTAKAVR